MDTEMKKITILVPADIVEAMKRLAAAERRSMNQEMIRAFEEHLRRSTEQQGN
jgi:predicted transcriptional regulator